MFLALDYTSIKCIAFLVIFRPFFRSSFDFKYSLPNNKTNQHVFVEKTGLREKRFVAFFFVLNYSLQLILILYFRMTFSTFRRPTQNYS